MTTKRGIIMEIAFLRATKGRLEVQRDKLRAVRNGLAEDQSVLELVIMDLDKIITEHDVRANASK